MKTFSNIFLILGIASIVCMIILYIAGYEEEAYLLTGTGIVCTIVSDLTYRQHKKDINKT